MLRMLSLSDLKARGIRFSRAHIYRLMAEGKFPKAVKLGENTTAWSEAEVDAYLEKCIATRDAKAAA